MNAPTDMAIAPSGVFVTVGTQLPFDRLVMAVDAWAEASGRRDVFAQIGPSARVPLNVACASFVSSDECKRRIAGCELVVAHAGMGSIITALQMGRRILVMPRLASRGEHRNDHQRATVRQLATLDNVHVCHDEAELPDVLDRLLSARAASTPIRHDAQPELIDHLAAFVEDRLPDLAARDRPAKLPSLLTRGGAAASRLPGRIARRAIRGRRGGGPLNAAATA